MRSYRFARRSFLVGVGGAFGLHTLLRNVEAIALGASAPPRFLMTHWPVGAQRHYFLPTGSDFLASRVLAPLEPLRDQTIVIYGLTDSNVNPGQGGGHEAGTVMTTTGANAPGTRANGGETDDACAGGPSWDQILLRNVPALQRPAGYVNVICDARVDSQETSTQCLSYGYTKRSVAAARPAGQNIEEAIPLLPELSPTQLYLRLFSGFLPGGDTPANREALLRGLHAKKSVFDYCLSELRELERLAPSRERVKIDEHVAAVQRAEARVTAQIDGPIGGACEPPVMPDAALIGKTGSKFDYGNWATTVADDVQHEAIGHAHAALIRAAFQCDLLRVATFQWSPGTNHVSFAGLNPDDPSLTWMHHPMSHFGTAGTFLEAPPSGGEERAKMEFLANVQTWYTQKTGDIVATFRDATDVYGGSLLDSTIIPFVSEISNPSHARSPKAALIFGGKKLGMKPGQLVDFQSSVRPHNDLWATIAQAYFGTANPLEHLAGEAFEKDGVTPIEGLWEAPA